jgi:hypothetical protein
MDREPGRIAGIAIGWVLRVLIRAYQLTIAGIIPPSCRYEPSCSHYATEAILRHGPLGGVHLAACRIARCHPWGGSGYDPVPDPARR